MVYKLDMAWLTLELVGRTNIEHRLAVLLGGTRRIQADHQKGTCEVSSRHR